ncbi:hypothetical protein BP5796_02683 [Coleophoma crateriformis]|uniref:Trichothecene 3-O-acetyltransferase-like N-terminal domain-containing protein n=1 Tax=Coleophoma crateriformis TaxID=565419 RepID=A0A3D8T0I4_9HELO|nr:hypothetical protein BP5796_02683 [Coleophoma crateriformis]
MSLALGPMGQMPRLSKYMIVALGFALEDGSDIQSTLYRAANEIVDSFPWLAGQVVVEKAAEDASVSSGTFKIIEYEPHDGKSKFVHVKDCKDLCPSYAELVNSRAPASMLDSSIICPEYASASVCQEDAIKPVVMLQANLIKGGLILTVCTHHCVMDANGNEQLILQFASLCRGEELLEEDIRLGNADQSTIVPPLKPGQDLQPLEMYRCPSSLGTPHGVWSPPPPPALWKTFRFTRSKIAELKHQASTLCSPDSDVKYVSSNDAVSTFIWTRIITIRSRWLPEYSNTSLYRAVNGRQKLDPKVLAGYMGHFIFMLPTKLPVQTVVHDKLSSTAIKVRRSLMADKTTINYGAKVNGEADLLMSSYVAQKLYKTSFGDLFGEPDFIRRPNLPGGKNLYYMMPATREGDIDLIAGLTKEEFDGLQMDSEWNEYAEYIG